MGDSDNTDNRLAGIDPDRINRFLSDELTSHEVVLLRRDIKAAGGDDLALDAMRQTFFAMRAGARSPSDYEGEWTDLTRRLQALAPSGDRRAHVTPSTLRQLTTNSRWLVGLAAVAVAAIGFTVWNGVAVSPGQPFREIVSAPGSRVTVTLRDGTRMVLAPGSRVRVPGDFGKGTRTVGLVGEAFFAVVHDAKHPFMVHTANATTRDVGTQFVVRAYPQDEHEQVAVTEGQVMVDDASLTAGDMAEIDGHAVAVAHGADLATMTAWLQGGLVFKETPLQQVVRDIGRVFGVRISIADSTLAAKRITASFSDQSVDAMLDEITRAVGARYERTPHTIIIRRGQAPVRGPRVDGVHLPLTTAQARSIQE